MKSSTTLSIYEIIISKPFYQTMVIHMPLKLGTSETFK